jgi:5-formyltetrahydrofolate cyclo-ligase
MRRSLFRRTPDAGERAARLAPAALFGRFSVVAGYHALGAEIDPAPLLRRLADAGARLALPVTLAHGEPLIFRAYNLGDPLVRDPLGMMAPGAEAEVVEPDLFVTPLVAFDRGGARMGQGGGFYDRTLAALRARRPIFALGVAFAGQEVARLPVEPHDQRLDAILTESAYIEAQKEF